MTADPALVATDLAATIRTVLAGDKNLRATDLREIKMFGGIGFMLNGNLLAGASKRGLLLRVGKDRQDEALARPGARPMVMRGRTMEGYVYIDPPALNDRSVRSWLPLAVAFVCTLPPKPGRTPRQKPAKQTGRNKS
jgi:TfoX/Sxy family transcriptional regulator of competence genes